MYRALYRKWRPRTFADVIGQDAIVQALRRQVEAGRVGHAYLFTGTRGTGKTTCAKILAKAVNCPHCQAGDPCGECEICRGVETGSLLDVEEIDAASNNGVDNVRGLREDAVYAPAMGRYKVYIIDEVHMLSTSAFNALLKIMEEPPEHLIFILATTEVHKVPVTVLSRCQRYDFMRISPQDIADRLAYVAEQENIDLTPPAALLLGQLADGAMRDALSLLDTCSGVGGTVDEALVRQVAGVTDKSYLFDISRAVAAGDVPALVAALNDPRTRTLDTRRLCEELIFHYRNLMLGALSQDGGLLLQVGQAEQARYLEDGKQLAVSAAAASIRRLGDALEHILRGGNARIELELALFALAGGLPQPPAAPAPGYGGQAAGYGGQAAAPSNYGGQPDAGPGVKYSKWQGAEEAPGAPAPLSGAVPGMDTPAPRAQTPGTQPFGAQTPGSSTSAGKTLGTSTLGVGTSGVSSGVTPPSAPPEGTVPFADWERVLTLVQQRDIPLASFLVNSAAYRQGGRVLIQGNNMLYDYLRTNKNSHANLKAALQEVTGEELGIGPYTAPRQQARQDPLEVLRNQGVEVQEV